MSLQAAHQTRLDYFAQFNRVAAQQFKMQVLNVKTDFGAVGDGAKDDTTRVLAALAAAKANGGGTVFFPVGTYLVQPYAIVLDTSTVCLQGDGGALPVYGRGTTITAAGPGTIIKGPTFSASSPTPVNNLYNVRVSRLTLAWAPAARHQPHCRGIDLSGLNSSVFEQVTVSLPIGSAAYAFYGTTTAIADVGQGTDWNEFLACTVDGEEGGGTPITPGSKGYYFATNSSNDGGGSNSNNILGGRVASCDVNYHIENAYGTGLTNISSDVPRTCHVQAGSPTAGVVDGIIGLVRYLEGGQFGAKFGDAGNPNVKNCTIQAGYIAPGITPVDPGSTHGNNNAVVQGQTVYSV